MAPRSRDEIRIQDSIEAKGDEDVNMEDAPAGANGDVQNNGTKSDTGPQTDADADADGEADAEGEAEEEESVEASTSRGVGRRRAPDTPHKRLLQLIDTVNRYLCDYEEKWVFVARLSEMLFGVLSCFPAANLSFDCSDELLTAGFQRLPKKNELPDYYEVISNAVAFSTVRVSEPDLF